MKTEIFKSLVLTVAVAGFFAGSVGCNRVADESVMRDDTIVTETASGTTYSADTYSGTTANAPATSPDTLNNSGAVPPVDTQTAAGSTMESDANTTETKTVKKTMKKKSDHKKGHKHGDHGAWNQRPSQTSDAYVYNNSVLDDSTDEAIFGSDDYFIADEGTVSGTTVGASTSVIDHGGLSPFSQEPASRTPSRIGSAQITGKDKSVSSLEKPSVFQEPSAAERDRLNR